MIRWSFDSACAQNHELEFSVGKSNEYVVRFSNLMILPQSKQRMTETEEINAQRQ